MILDQSQWNTPDTVHCTATLQGQFKMHICKITAELIGDSKSLMIGHLSSITTSSQPADTNMFVCFSLLFFFHCIPSFLISISVLQYSRTAVHVLIKWYFDVFFFLMFLLEIFCKVKTINFRLAEAVEKQSKTSKIPK